MANGLGVRADPVLAYNFLISLVDSSSELAAVVTAIQSIALGGFSECSGLEMSLQVHEYQEGGRNGAVLKFPTRVTWSPEPGHTLRSCRLPEKVERMVP